MSAIYVSVSDLLKEGLTPTTPLYSPGGRGRRRGFQGRGGGNSWVQQLLPWGEAPVMAVRRLLLGVGAAAADIAPAIPTPASRRRAAAAAGLTRLRREGEGIFRVPSRVLECVLKSVTKTPLAIFKFFSPQSPCPVYLEAKKRNWRFKVTQQFAERTPASLLCASRLARLHPPIRLGGFVGRHWQFVRLGGASEPSAFPLPQKAGGHWGNPQLLRSERFRCFTCVGFSKQIVISVGCWVG